VTVGDVRIGGDALVFIGGPCVLEEPERVLHIATTLRDLCRSLSVPYVFKASFDKANRTSLSSYRGPGLREGLELLAAVRRLGVPVTTDVHEPAQAEAVAEVVDLLQVPAFLCRQTDLLVACAATGRPVNVKKGQFLAPEAVGPLVDKLAGARGVLLTERGTSFGHGDLVVDFRGLPTLREHAPVVFDATHSTQRPSALGDRSGGDRSLAAPLARAAAAVGIDALFAEVHDDPPSARSDAATQLALDEVEPLLRQVVAVHATAAPPIVR
jgi:2-dehydro-3-deoxyphosphooctonate aldolase (KDO 8-P synthase)